MQNVETSPSKAQRGSQRLLRAPHVQSNDEEELSIIQIYPAGTLVERRAAKAQTHGSRGSLSLSFALPASSSGPWQDGEQVPEWLQRDWADSRAAF
jgi:hypothetical protein